MEKNYITEPPKPTLGMRIVSYIIYLIVVIAIAIGVLFLYWKVQSPVVLDVKNSPFPVHPTIVAQEQIVFMSIDYCKKADISGTVTARLVGKRSIIRLPWPDDTQRPNCIKADVPVPVPAYAGDDIYHFEFDAVYKINPIKKQDAHMRSQEFTVQARR